MPALRRSLAATACLVLLAACGAADDATPTLVPAGEASPPAAATATTPPFPTGEATPDAPSSTASAVAARSYALVARWGSPAALPIPADVAVLPDGSIVVGGLLNGDVTIFGANGELRTSWRARAFTRTIATGPDGQIYAWTEDGLLALDQDGNVLGTTPIAGMPVGQPPPLVDLAVAADGTISLAAGLGPGIGPTSGSTPAVFNGVIALDAAGTEVGRWELPDALRLRHVVTLPDSSIAVAVTVARSVPDSDKDIPDQTIRIDPGTFSGDWETGATTLDGIWQVDGLAALPDSSLAVLQAKGDNPGDADETTLVRLGPDGAEIGRWALEQHGGRYLDNSVRMAATDDGTLLIVDGANHRVMRVGTDGEVSGEIGAPGPNTFGEPQGIAIGPDGNVYVFDPMLARVISFDPGGAIAAELALPQEHAWVPGIPQGMAVAADGRIFVTDGMPGEVIVLTTDGEVVGRWTQPVREVPGGISIFDPSTVAISDDDILYIGDFQEPVLDLYTPNGELLGSWPFAGKPGQVFDIASWGTSSWAIVGGYGYRIERLDGRNDDAAEVIFEVPTTGERPDILPTSIALDNEGNVYLADPFVRVIVKLDARGQEITRWELGVEQPRVIGASLQLAVGDDGRVYVADAGTGQVLVYAPE